MATLHAMIALSDGPNRLQSCPFNMIGQCYNLQPSACRRNKYSLQREEGKGWKVSIPPSSFQQAQRRGLEGQNFTEEERRVPALKFQTAALNQPGRAQNTDRLRRCLLMDVIMWQVSQKVIFNFCELLFCSQNVESLDIARPPGMEVVWPCCVPRFPHVQNCG